MTTISDPVLGLAVAAVIALVFGLGAWGARRYPRGARTPDERLQAVETRLEHVEVQLDRTQADSVKIRHDIGNMRMMMQTLPHAKDVSEVKVQVAGLTGKVDGVVSGQHAMHASIDRVERFLMDAAAKAIVAGRSTSGGEP